MVKALSGSPRHNQVLQSTRLHTTNLIEVEVEENFKIKVAVMPRTKKD